MAQGLFSIGGLASGLDTASLVNDLMNVERLPIRQMESRQKTFQSKLDAWGQITTRVSALRSSINDLKDLRDFAEFTKVSSSDEDAVGVAIKGTPSTGSVSFTVDQLASNQQSISQASFADANALVGAGTFDITVGGDTHTITTTDSTTLGQLSSAINGLGIDVKARVLNVGTADNRLMLSGDETGIANAFTITSTATNLTGFDTMQAAQDALVTVGSGAGALQVSRGSNTFSDLVQGVEIDLNATSGTPITIGVDKDLDAAVEAVQSLVDELNNTIGKVQELSKYNGEDADAGVLLGDSTARRLVDSLRSAMGGVVAGLAGDKTFAGSVGVTLNAEGKYDLDAAKLREAFEEDFDGVAELFARAGNASDSRVQFARGGDDTKVQDHTVQITRAAQVASVTGAAYTSPPTDPQPFTITTDDGTIVTVQISSGDSVDAAVTKINAALEAASVNHLRATYETVDTKGKGKPQDMEDYITIASTSYGSAGSFTIADDEWGMAGAHVGVDVEGTINGEAATGVGQTLTGDDDTDADGLVLAVTASQADVDGAGGTLDLGTVSFTGGLVGALSSVLEDAEGTDGDIARAKELWQDRIDLYDERIERFEDRLEQREITIRRQFSAMETAMSSLQSQGNWLNAQLASMF